MARSFNKDRLSKTIVCIIVFYFAIVYFWYQDLFNLDDGVSRSEYAGECVYEYGKVEKCYEPIIEHENNKKAFYKFAIGGIISGLSFYGIYKFIDYIYPKLKENNN